MRAERDVGERDRAAAAFADHTNEFRRLAGARTSDCGPKLTIKLNHSLALVSSQASEIQGAAEGSGIARPFLGPRVSPFLGPRVSH